MVYRCLSCAGHGLVNDGDWCSECSGTGLARSMHPYTVLEREELVACLTAIASQVACYRLVVPYTPQELVQSLRAILTDYDRLRAERAALAHAWTGGDWEIVEAIATEAYLGVL
ncbi:MAG: hypothetical protein RMJ05_07005 [Thermomicrobium sp.]|nr:hypothetical protein [Thermomicrobium sp.]MDW8060013.1 hypothetical protein [Thermomicrobium sp.]